MPVTKIYNPQIHHRRSIRLKGYDYSQAGLYFITLCCQDRECLFGKIKDGVMQLNAAGQMIQAEWLDLPNRFSQIILHEYNTMPNHFHGIIEIVGAPPVGAQIPEKEVAGETGNNVDKEKDKGHPRGVPQLVLLPKSKTVGEIIGAFKSITTVKYIQGVQLQNWQAFNQRVWQRNFWEHIIRNEQAYHNISCYIQNNAAKWGEDSLRK